MFSNSKLMTDCKLLCYQKMEEPQINEEIALGEEQKRPRNDMAK